MKVAVVGHPFANVGMGEQIRACVRSLRAARIECELIDVYKAAPRTDPDHRDLVGDSEVQRCASRIRIFHINGDEIEPVLAHITNQQLDFESGYNIVVPAWELPVYPAIWVNALRRFDEIWALSDFVRMSLAAAGLESVHIGQSCEIPFRTFLPKRYFGIRESAFVFLHFFDLSSYATRKNPDAVIRVFQTLRKLRPYDDIQLVLKVKSGNDSGADWLAPIRDRVPEALLLSDVLNTFETHSLLAASDCFVSLHRAEGFGRGAAEAMSLGKLALATNWSGNLDYMTAGTSLLARYRLVDILPGEYPYGEGQQWAEVDVDHAAALGLQVIDRPDLARSIAREGMVRARMVCGNRAVGLRMLLRLRELEKVTEVRKREDIRGGPIDVSDQVAMGIKYRRKSAGLKVRTDRKKPRPAIRRAEDHVK
jgi:glycosyltransferase involved in cell wall biosynthesis